MASRSVPMAQSTISRSNFRAGRDNIIKNEIYYGASGFDSSPIAALKEHAALGALHDAAERPDPPKCHPETRTAVLDRVDGWVRDRSAGAKAILWLSGAAGAGKSAIAQTSIERWLEEDFAIPNFFFWRTGSKRNVKTHLIATIAFQLSKMLPGTKPHIRRAIRDGSIFEQSLKAQVQRLIVDPLVAVNQPFPRRIVQKLCAFIGVKSDWVLSPRVKENIRPICIVIDGLDECCIDLVKVDGFPGQNHEDQQREILEAAVFACQKIPFLRVLVASRPERQIRISFSGTTLKELSLFLSLNDEGNSLADIALYLDCKFAEFRLQYPGLEPTWPSQEQISKLIEKSSGQFIYPSTVVKYISRRRQFPVKSLEEVLAIQTKPKDEHPLAELDALYTLVLSTVDRNSWETVKLLLGIVCFVSVNASPHHATTNHNRNDDRSSILPAIFTEPAPGLNVRYLSRFLLLTEGELLAHLTDLHSILSLSTTSNSLTEIRFYHATFSEYLQDQSRSGRFSISRDETHLQCALHLTAHASIAKSSHIAAYCKGWQRWLYPSLAAFLEHSPVSKVGTKEIWTLLASDIGEYSRAQFHLRSVEFGDNILPVSEGPFYSELGPRDRLRILQYLQKCNIPEIEPSRSHRQAISRYLSSLIDLSMIKDEE